MFFNLRRKDSKFEYQIPEILMAVFINSCNEVLTTQLANKTILNIIFLIKVVTGKNMDKK